MSLHDHDVSQRLNRFLKRKQMPRRFEGKDGAQEDEILALSAAAIRYAPRGDRLHAWWPAFETALGEVCGPMWPTEKEIRDAAQAATKATPQPRVEASERREGPDPAAMIGQRMAARAPVGEGWLWGIGAVELAARGLIDAETMRAYRSAAFFNRKRMYGEPAALAWEDERKAAHEAAKAVWKSRDEQRRPHDTQMPDVRGWAGVAAE